MLETLPAFHHGNSSILSVSFDGIQTRLKNGSSQSWGVKGETFASCATWVKCATLNKLNSCNPQQQNSFPNRKALAQNFTLFKYLT